MGKQFSPDVPKDPISPLGYIEACINLANNPSEFEDGEVAPQEPAPDAGLINVYLTIMNAKDPEWTMVIHEDFAKLNRRDAKALRSRVRDALSTASSSLATARRKRRKAIDGMLDGISVETDLCLKADGRVEHQHRYKPVHHDSAIALLWMFLLDPGRPFGNELRQCALPDCGRFFLAQKNPSGGPRRKYCSTDHAHKADKLKAMERYEYRKKRKRNGWNS